MAQPNSRAQRRLGMSKSFREAAIMSLTASSSFTQSSTPARSTELAGGAYVLAIAQLENEYAVLSSAPSNKIHLYDRASLRPAASFDAHSTAATSLQSFDNINGTSRRVLLSSGRDVTVKVWDARKGELLYTLGQELDAASEDQEEQRQIVDAL